MKKTKLPIYDEKVSLLFPRDLCDQAAPIANVLGVSVSQLFIGFCKAAVIEHEGAGEPTQDVYVDVPAEELNAIVTELEQSAL